jgi:fructose-1-phosphate kinase PfkB-like protein
MARIVVTGLNPAWQKILEFDALTPGRVNRAVTRQEFGSGKGLNAALVLRRLGHDVCLVQIVGGTNGRRHEEYCRAAGVTPLFVRVSQETRVCSTLIDRASGQATELIEPFEVQPEERARERLLDLIGDLPAPDALLMSGTAPTGIDGGIYLEIARALAAPLLVLDVVREMSRELLAQAHFLKINATEYEELQRKGILTAADPDGLPVLLITDGPRPARMIQWRRAQAGATTFRLPELPGVVNPIGAGDTVAGYLTHALLGGQSPETAFREALAAGSASCLTLRPGDYDEATRQALAADTVVA